MSISLIGAHHSKQHSGLKCHEALWPLPPLTVRPSAQSTHARKPEGALPPVESDDSLNAGWDGPCGKGRASQGMVPRSAQFRARRDG